MVDQVEDGAAERGRSVLVGRLAEKERARLRSTLMAALTALFVVNTVWQIGRGLLPDDAFWIVCAIVIVVPVIAAVAVRRSTARRYRGFHIAPGGDRLRTADGDVQVPGALRSALLETAAEQRHPFSRFIWRTGLRLEFRDGTSVRVLLRVDDRIVLVEEERAALRAFLARTDPEVPRPPEDPNGRFAGVRYTGRMTRDEVLRLVERPPGRDDPFPAPV